MDNKKITKKEELSESDIERLELLQMANEKVGKQLTIDSQSGIVEEKRYDRNTICTC